MTAISGFLGDLAPLLAERRAEFEQILANTLPNTPSDCPCGRTENQHLESSIVGLKALESLDQGDATLFWTDAAERNMNDAEYAEWTSRQLFGPTFETLVLAGIVYELATQLRGNPN